MTAIHEPPTSALPARAPRLAEGIEMIGEYEGSGFKETPFLARRADGQTLQLTALLYSVAAHADGRRDEAAIATAVSEEVGRKVSPDNVRFLVEKKLRPLGVLAAADGSSPELTRPDPLLALKFRTAVVPARLTRGLTTLFRPLFWPPVLALVIAGFLALGAWLLLEHGIAQGLRHAIYQPLLLLGMFAAVVVATAFHETGHATACRYGGAKPGVMGVGLYIVWPAFYTDVTDAYRLGRGGRLRTDLGGIYFNAIFALAAGGLYALPASSRCCCSISELPPAACRPRSTASIRGAPSCPRRATATRGSSARRSSAGRATGSSSASPAPRAHASAAAPRRHPPPARARRPRPARRGPRRPPPPRRDRHRRAAPRATTPTATATPIADVPDVDVGVDVEVDP